VSSAADRSRPPGRGEGRIRGHSSGRDTTSGLTRRGLLAAGLAALPACATAQPAGAPGPVATPFDLPGLPENTLVRPLGGLEIDRAQLGFGGLSALHVAPDLTVTTVSDLARFAEFTLSLDDECRPQGLVLRRAGWLRDGAGRGLPRGYAGDAESLARLPDGSWLIGFERWHRIRRYRDVDGPAEYFEAPPGIENAPANAGLEALAVLADGRLLAIAEEMAVPELPGATAAWLGRPGDWTRIGWRPGQGLLPVDAAPLPGGGALVLERGFSLLGGFSGRLTRVPAAALAAATPGSVLEGEEILRIAPPLPVDNFEGVAAFTHRGRLLVAMLSDDNQNRLQRGLLLLFELRGAPPA
jgi:hypothetical protein